MRQAQSDRVIRKIPHTHKRRRQLIRNMKHAMLLVLMVAGTFFFLRYVFYVADYVPQFYEPKDLEREDLEKEIEKAKESIKNGEIPLIPSR